MPPRQTPPRPGPTPTPEPTPTRGLGEESGGPLPENTQNLVNQVERAVESQDPFLMIFQLHRFAGARPEDMPGDIWTDLYTNLTGALGQHLGVSATDAGITNLPLLESYRQAFAGARNLQLRLSAGGTPESMLDEASAWMQQYTEFIGALGRTAGEPLSRRLRSFLLAADQAGGTTADSFNTLIGTFRAAGVSATPPTLPPDPSDVEGVLGAGDGLGGFGPGGGGGSFTSTVTEELRPPTAEEFMNDFDNAFLTFLGMKVEDMSATQIASAKERRDELLGRYVQRLGEFAESGESPFLESTRTGEVVSETVSGPTGSQTIRRGVEMPRDIGVGFLTAKVTPTNFLTDLFPTTTAFRNFAVGPQPGKSPVAREGFAAGTKFQGER